MTPVASKSPPVAVTITSVAAGKHSMVPAVQSRLSLVVPAAVPVMAPQRSSSGSGADLVAGGAVGGA
jgi:hypothetical protein